MSRRHLLPIVAAALCAVAYLALLHLRSKQAEPPLLVLYHSGPTQAPVADPESGLLAWATPRSLAAATDQIRQRRGKRPTELLDAAPQRTSLRRVEIDQLQVALVELAPGGLALAQAQLAQQSADLVVVATSEPIAEVQASFSAPLAILPGRFGPGAPGEVVLKAQDSLVAPWVDSRWRLGALDVRPGAEAIELKGSSVALRGEKAPADAPRLLGRGDPELAHDLIHFGQGGLGGRLAAELRQRTGADLALLNYLSLRAGLTGEVDLAGLKEALPFHNQVVLLDMQGADLLEELAANAEQDRRYLVVAGAQAADPGWLMADGRPLQPEASYRVATVDYLADGGRGKRPAFLRASTRIDTGLYTDRIALDLLQPPESP